jgi:hypothetical protein
VSLLRARLIAAGVLVATGLGYSSPARADAPRVLLVRPPGAAREVKTALVRVEGELAADGFEVVPIEAAPGASSAMSMLQAENSATSTTVGLFLNEDGTSAELWVVDKLTDKTVVRHLATRDQSEKMLPEVLAVRAVELLRASLLELMVERNNAAAAASRSAALRAREAAKRRASEWAARPIRPAPELWAVETGAAVIWSPGQVEPAFVSVGRGRVALSQRLQIRLSFIGFGTRPEVTGAGGRAAIEQWCGLAELVFAPFRDASVRPIFSLGAGTFHTAVTGEALFPYQGLHSTQWAFAADAGLGLSWSFASRLELALEGHGLWTAPEPIVRFAGEDGAHIGRPGVIGSLSLLGWL